MRSDLINLLPFVVVAITCIPTISAIDLDTCTNDIMQDWISWNSSNNTSPNHLIDWTACSPLKPSDVADITKVTLTYPQCMCLCGSGLGVLSWNDLTRNFGTWISPWIALMFQLPLGSEDMVVNLMSILLAIGSPALACYSLAITHLNNLWLEKEFAKIPQFPNKEHVPIVLSTLQHVPFKLADLSSLASLVVIPQYDEWWAIMARASRKSRRWTIPAAVSICWATVSILLTLIDSLVDFASFYASPGDSGYAIAAIWSYLLPLVAGWFQIGSQPEAYHLRDALEEANSNARRVAIPSTRRRVASEVIGRERCAIEYAKHDVQRPQGDEKNATPIFNYSRVFIWSSQTEFMLHLYQNASAKAKGHITVDGSDWDFEHPERNTVGSNIQVVKYCLGDSPGLDVIHESQPMIAEGRYIVWAPRVTQRVLIATIFGLGVQWGTTTAAILIPVETPPTGFGCRSLTFAVYGILSTIVFILMLLSSFLSHKARPWLRYHKRPGFNSMAYISRWMGKSIAVINGLGMLVSCILQLSGGYDNCYCNTTTFGGSVSSGTLTFYFGSYNFTSTTFYKVWIGGIALAISSCLSYLAAVYVASPMVV